MSNLSPITSYGLIAYNIQESESTPSTSTSISSSTDNYTIRYLLYQRRDNFEFMEFMMGYYTGLSRLKMLFEEMSIDEHERIRNYTFDELWNDLWVDHNIRIYKSGYKYAKDKYEKHKNKIDMLLTKHPPMNAEPPWGFPKGKKEKSETKMVAGIREFEEESRIEFRMEGGKMRTDIIPFREDFVGSNNKSYRTYYYVGELDNLILPIDMLNIGGIRKSFTSPEALRVEWCTLAEAEILLPIRRLIMLKQLDKLLREEIGTSIEGTPQV